MLLFSPLGMDTLTQTGLGNDDEVSAFKYRQATCSRELTVFALLHPQMGQDHFF